MRLRLQYAHEEAECPPMRYFAALELPTTMGVLPRRE